MIKKELYAAPETEVLELRLEGVIAGSGDPNKDYVDPFGGKKKIFNRKEERTMRKSLLFAAAVLAFAACSKENTVKEEASKIVFNINVENANATKDVKTVWESGDVVYAFFEDNTTQYVKMTYNGTSWAYTDKSGGTTFEGLTLAASGKKVSAVYMPAFVCSAAPTYTTDKWTFGDVSGYFQTAESVDYIVTTMPDVTTLYANLRLTAPDGISQVFIPSLEYSTPTTGNEHVLTATHIAPFTFSGIAPGGDATLSTGTYGFPLTPYSGTIGSGTGYYFWGILESAGKYDFTFQLVERNATYKYAISSKPKGPKSMTVSETVAVKVGSLTDNGKFVDLGYGGPLWATGNLDKTNDKIVDPLEAGEYFAIGGVTPLTFGEYSGWPGAAGIPIPDAYDAAYQTNNAWRTPADAQFVDLIGNTTNTWFDGITSLGVDGGGCLITSNTNGISLFFAAAGSVARRGLKYENVGTKGSYNASTFKSSSEAWTLSVSNGGFSMSVGNVQYCRSIRPVKN